MSELVVLDIAKYRDDVRDAVARLRAFERKDLTTGRMSGAHLALSYLLEAVVIKDVQVEDGVLRSS